MSRTARSYPRAELIRARRAWLGSRGRPALAYVSGVSLLMTAVVVAHALLVGVDVGSMVLGVLVGGTAVGLLAFVQMGISSASPAPSTTCAARPARTPPGTSCASRVDVD